MSNLFKVKIHLQAVINALDNVEHGRVPLEYFEEVFANRTEVITGLIAAEKRAVAGEND